MRNQQNVKVKVNSNFETICPFPVGYVYMSSNSTSPADIYGGTWASISGSRYMRAASAWGNGGSNTITVDQIPSHSHPLRWSISNYNNATLYGLIPYSTNPSPDNVGTGSGILSTEGGNRSIQHIKTSMLGAELRKGSRVVVEYATA